MEAWLGEEAMSNTVLSHFLLRHTAHECRQKSSVTSSPSSNAYGYSFSCVFPHLDSISQNNGFNQRLYNHPTIRRLPQLSQSPSPRLQTSSSTHRTHPQAHPTIPLLPPKPVTPLPPRRRPTNPRPPPRLAHRKRLRRRHTTSRLRQRHTRRPAHSACHSRGGKKGRGRARRGAVGTGQGVGGEAGGGWEGEGGGGGEGGEGGGGAYGVS